MFLHLLKFSSNHGFEPHQQNRGSNALLRQEQAGVCVDQINTLCTIEEQSFYTYCWWTLKKPLKSSNSKTPRCIGKKFPVNSSVKQRCALFPLLFIILLDYAMRSFDQNCIGLS